MAPLLSLLTQASNHAADQSASSLSLGGKDMIAAHAADATFAGIFPIGAAFVVLGCLMISGFVLLMRESRMELAHR